MNNKYLSFALALLASLVIWLISNLSQNTTAMTSVQVLAHSSILGRSSTATEPVSISANVTASGFRLLRLSLQRKRIRDVSFAPEAFVHQDGDFYSISANSLVPYTEKIFGSGTTAQYAADRVTLRFRGETYKKVPILAVEQIRFSEQYMPSSPIRLSPDSVLVYGSPERLEEVTRVLTRPIIAFDVNRSISGKAGLSVPEGIRIPDTDLHYTLDVSRYVEVQENYEIGVRNVPEGKRLSLFPQTAKISFRMVFPLSGAAPTSADFYVDYDDFANSIGGKCMIRSEGLPSSVLQWEADPPYCECIESDND